MAKKRTKRKAATKTIPDKQGNSQVGYSSPPAEHQFRPGESGNPKGPPRRRVQLWTYICRYMAMTEEQLERVEAKKNKLNQSEQLALRIVKDMQKLGFGTLDRFIRYVIDRDEGKPTEHLLLTEENALTDEQCERIRGLLLKNYAD